MLLMQLMADFPELSETAGWQVILDVGKRSTLTRTDITATAC